MKKITEMTRIEFAAYIASTLEEQGIEVVLSGGSCVSIYSSESYVSGDLDFIRLGIVPWNSLRRVLKSLGFHEENRYFRHPDSVFWVEFPGGPPSIGEERLSRFNIIETETGTLKLLTPTDCIKDTLAAFYHWNDQESLEQAVLVSKHQKIDMKDIENWSKREGKYSEFLRINNLLKKSGI